MKKIPQWPFLMLIFLALKSGGVMAQGICPNVDFSLGTFDSWEGYYGHYENPEENYGFMNRRHTIITDKYATDPRTCDNLLMIPPGETYSARLGNSSNLAEAEQLRYTIPVTEENNLFIYKYAVVLEDPGHIPEHQPNFTIEIRDQAGNLIDPVCGYYYVYAQPQMPGWHTCTQDLPVHWKNWTTVGLDLSSLEGDTVTIVFTTRDCQEGAHYGYAYISAHCSMMQLTVGFCPDKDHVTVTAPPGFSYLWETGQTSQSIVIPNPIPGMTISCTLTAVNGCQVTIQSTIQPTFVNTGFTVEEQCSRVPVQFNDTSRVNQNFISEWSWNFGDGTPVVTGTPSPTHAFAEGGDYQVTLEVMSSDSCKSTSSQTVHIEPNVDVDLGPDHSLRKNETVTLDAGNPGASYLWSTGATTREITVGNSEQVYWVQVTRGSCTGSDTLAVHTLYGCSLDVPTAFSPNGDGQNDVLMLFPREAESFELMVYDRSGEMVFQTGSFSATWDGTYRGNPLGVGVYNYLLRVRCDDGSDYVTRGTVTLLR